MLETIQEKITLQNLQSKDKKSSLLLKKEEVEQLHQQFNRVRGIRPDKQNTIQWRSIEYYQEVLVRSEWEGTAGYTFKHGFEEEEVVEVIESLLMNIYYILDSGDVL